MFLEGTKSVAYELWEQNGYNVPKNVICSVGNPKQIGKTGLKIVALFAITYVFGAVIAIVLGNVFKPGANMKVVVPPMGLHMNQALKGL